MKRKYWLFLICAAAFLGGVLAGFLTRQKNYNTEPPTEINAEAVIYEDETIIREDREINYYYVSVTGDFLTVEAVYTDNTKEEIMGTWISLTSLPEKETEILKKGVAFENAEDALMMAESFVS